MAKLGGEVGAVQEPIVRYVSEKFDKESLHHLGWEEVPRADSERMRGGETGLIYKELFINQMMKLNPEFMDRTMAEQLISKLERLSPDLQGNMDAWEYLRGQKTVFVPEENRERNVVLIDHLNLDRNIFQVTSEFSYYNGTKRNRADVVFLINGIPVLILEAKAAHKTDGISEGLSQIERYHRQTPELLSLPQTYSLTHLVKFFYSATWNWSAKWVFDWKDENREAKDLESLVKSFFDRRRVVKLLRDYILFTRVDDELSKIVLRPHQMRAVQKIEQRAKEKTKKRGLIWHTQGSGKTYSMIVTAKSLIENPIFENPTVLMLVDRNELEAQLFQNLEAVGFEHLHIADSKKDLRSSLRDDNRGLIVSTIHKFDEMPESINERENIFVLIDEAHRTTGGKLGTYLMAGLPHATLIGFTGTPIDNTSQGKSTFITFGKDDPKDKYLDKYSIGESIEDGTTVELHYSLAPGELRVDRETLDREFMDLAETEGISDVEVLNKVLEKAVNLRTMLKKPERIDAVAEFVVDHYKKYVEPSGYKAFLVGVDREACALYKKALDKYLPKEASEVVYSAGHNDDELLEEFHLSDEQEKKIRKKFRKPETELKFLIVTEKLLTGFDAPILYAMYLDKPMRDHVLLQAIARVNRPYEDKEQQMKKKSGLVFDFVGIFENFEKALAFDSSDIEGVIKDIELLKDHFANLMETARKDYLSVFEKESPDKAIQIIVDHFHDEETRKNFYEFFSELSNVYEILSPDAFLRPYLNDYETLARLYRILREAFEPSPILDKEFMRKTQKLVQEHTESGNIKGGIDIYEVDENTLKLIEDSGKSDKEKVINLIRSLEQAVEKEKEQNPVLVSIGEKAEQISKAFKGRQESTQKTLEVLKKLLEEFNNAREAKEKTGFSNDVFTAFWVLKQRELSNAAEIARSLEPVFGDYEYWKQSEDQERKVKQRMTKLLLEETNRNEVPAKEIVELVGYTLKMLKRENHG